MDKEIVMSEKSPYAGISIVLTTKHSKSIAIAPSFLKKLSAHIIECEIDTDTLGTFSGEVERVGTAIDCAKLKCEFGLNFTNSMYGLSSEGSFGPHPYIPFLACNNEILYFIDRQRDFNVSVSRFTEKTNYNSELVDSIKDLHAFAKKALFPSHALIIRSDNQDAVCLYKGIQTIEKLEVAFNEAMKVSVQGKVLVETDMRAHMNPSRMLIIAELAEELAHRLSLLCTACQTPGWGKVAVEQGLQCSWCGMKTEMIKFEIYGCAKCDHQEKVLPSHGLVKADPGSCSNCNP